MKIYAFIVTFNRLSLLKQTLSAVKNQSHAIDQVIVINNSSTDGTKEWLSSQENITVIEQENSGGAGGFHTGLKYCYEKGADWIWMMDDDVFPDTKCLENLLLHQNKSSCLQPVRYSSDGKLKIWNKYFSLEKKRFYLYDNITHFDKEVDFINTLCFEGLLINRKIVAKIGFPDKRFFIAGDDTIYGYLANRHTNNCIVNNAIMSRAKASTDKLISPMYIYYIWRNNHLFEDYYTEIFNKKKYPLNVKGRLLLEFTYNALLVILIKKNKVSILRAMLRGLIDSARKKTNRSY